MNTKIWSIVALSLLIPTIPVAAQATRDRPAVKRAAETANARRDRPTTLPANRPGARPNRDRNTTVNVNRTRNININADRNRNWTGRRINVSVYRYPRGYRYHRHTIGHTLPRVFLNSAYFYAGWAALGLYAPPSRYVWVRYGSDIYLVDRYSGYVRDVRYNVFY